MEQAEVNERLAYWKEKLLTLGIPLGESIAEQVFINPRTKSRLGLCRCREKVYTIEISATLLGKQDLVDQTLIHELLHTCPDCMNHGPLWKKYAAIARQAFGFDISRTLQLSPVPRKHKYQLQCVRCGKMYYRDRMCSLVKAPWRYRCKCGGRIFLKSYGEEETFKT